MSAKSDNSRKRKLPKKEGYHWNEGLLKSMKDPSKIVYEDDVTVAIKDLWPKATIHYLVCPKQEINDLRSVKIENLDLLKHMHKVAKELTEKHSKVFLLGYHLIPSMIRLHLHVISDDFDSPFMKTKKHWNSFTTEYFLDSEKIIEELETTGKINFNLMAESNNFIKKPLQCHKCSYKPKNMPDLKIHIKTHLS